MTMRKEIALLTQAWINWNNDPMGQRFGEHVLSTYFPGVRCPSIFYEQNSEVALDKLNDHLVYENHIVDWIEK